MDKYLEGLREAVEEFKKWVLNQREIVKVLSIVRLGRSGKSTLVTHLYNTFSILQKLFLVRGGKIQFTLY